MFEAWHVRQQHVEQQEEQLRQTLRQMSDAERLAFYRSYYKRIKDPDTFAALNWCFVAGLHNFYIGQWLAGVLDLGLMIIGILLLFVWPAVGAFLLVLVSLIELPALFRSQVIIAHINNQIAFDILAARTHLKAIQH